MCNHSDNNHKIRKGTSLENKEAHAQDHQTWNRRSFLQTLGLAGGSSMVLNGLPLRALGHAPFSTMANPGNEKRVLVLIRLKGGNDGLNMIVPEFDYGKYQAARPTISIPQNNLSSLNSEFSIPNSMQSLLPLWNEGQMKVINSVGYADPNLSHFESTDIWSTASDSNNIQNSGWLGRLYANCNPEYLENPADIPPAIKIGGPNSRLFNDPEGIDLSVNLSSVSQLEQIAETGMLYDNLNLPDDCYYGEQVGFIRTIANNAFKYAEIIAEAFEKGTNNVTYTTLLGNQLSVVSKLIKGDLGTQLYLVTLDGFDTHVDQNVDHPKLMTDISSAISEFYRDLKSDIRDQDVLCMTFSEFGRRVQQNASGGTDHGTAAPVMLFGPALNGNDILGSNPNLSDLDEIGNLKHQVDFRSIYTTLLEYWLCVPPSDVDTIMGQAFERIELGIECNPISGITNSPIQAELTHQILFIDSGSIGIQFELTRPNNVSINVYSILGQKVQNIYNGYTLQGKHIAEFHGRKVGISSMPLVYKITYGKNQVSGKFLFAN